MYFKTTTSFQTSSESDEGNLVINESPQASAPAESNNQENRQDPGPSHANAANSVEIFDRETQAMGTEYEATQYEPTQELMAKQKSRESKDTESQDFYGDSNRY